MSHNHLIFDAESIEIESMKTLGIPFKGKIPDDGTVVYKDFSSGCTAFACAADVLFVNRVAGIGLDGNITSSLLKEIISFYKKANRPRFFIQVTPDVLTDKAKKLLKDCNAVYYSNWIKSYKEVSKPVLDKDKIETGIAGVKDKERISEILMKSFSFPPEMKTFSGTIVGAKGWTCFCALIDGQIAGTGSLFVKDNIAELGVAATDESFRGKGIQSRLITVREELALKMNCPIMFVETMEPTEKNPAQSYRNVMRYGFSELYRRANYLLKL